MSEQASPADDVVSEALDVAIRAARRAGEVIRNSSDRPGWVRQKGRADPVTAVDVAAEEAILSEIRGAFPEHAVLSEETGWTEAGTAGPGDSCTWLVDPLDGTLNFVQGLPGFSVSVGMACRNQMVVGVVYDPARDELFSAVRGGGTLLNGAEVGVGSRQGSEVGDGDDPLRVPWSPDLRDAVIDVELGALLRQSKSALALWSELPQKVGGVRGIGSTALSLAYVACGRLDGSWICTPHAWDYAAGSLLVIEAGYALRGWNRPYDVMGGSGLLAGKQRVVDELWNELNITSRRGNS